MKCSLSRIAVLGLLAFGATAAASGSAEARPHNRGTHNSGASYGVKRMGYAFARLDANHNGYISQWELRAAPLRLKRHLIRADINHDGYITQYEFRIATGGFWTTPGYVNPWTVRKPAPVVRRPTPVVRKPVRKPAWNRRNTNNRNNTVRTRDHRSSRTPDRNHRTSTTPKQTNRRGSRGQGRTRL